MTDARQTAAIIGGGVIGGGWAARFLLMGWDVRVHDPDPEAERKIGDVLAGARRALPMLYDVALPDEGTLTFHNSVGEAVTGAAWVQESVPERLDLKHRVFAEIQSHLDPEAVIGSSTSGFKPSELQQGAKDPTQILVTHPFNPVYLLPLVELVPGDTHDPRAVAWAEEVLTGLGMAPLRVRAEIDAHIADRFLEAVWREALWLIKDGIATTAEIDEAIRMGFGLRWAQMGLFETYRIAGGEAGMRHFIEQFGPALAWPWTKLMDVPELDDALIDRIAAQSDAQSGHLSIRELERLRDDNLVAMLRALRQQGSAAGAHLNAHEAQIAPAIADASPLVTVRRTVPVDWTDYNGHMNEGRYGQVFSDAADFVMRLVGADADYIASGLSYFTVETTVKYLAETHAGAPFHVVTQVLEGAGKKLKLYHEMRGEDGTVQATCEQMLIHVSLETRRSCPPRADVEKKVEELAASHGAGA
ncbi:carnitine 3-dehydrogenase [Pseudaestuariivita atlantica]|uniref:L-carnitine dehydrogenase n=1 Tax=Pseudaestuariivita atlantica TaxID=1317121 RepID=A0A0L1JUS6_9RHOB|nr:carnitine 3-dehydrogenase [Pseudaestuariivita atlantica]KNG95529.1 3-hydroxyacyl-CoA dehydrogenase [Pseudaestuariivita atlantica]